MSQEEKKEANWYVIHTYSGYENKVKTDLEKTIKNRELEDFFFNIVVPMEEQVEIKDGKRKSNLKKVFPGYVLIKMIVTEESWYIVRNTRGVTGFVGPGSKPVPLTAEEMMTLGVKTNEKINVDFEEGEMVNVIAGVWAGTAGEVKRIDDARQTVTISVDMFGRETPVELNFTEVKKLK